MRKRGYEVISFADPTACPLYNAPHCTCPHEHSCGEFLLSDNHMQHLAGLAFVERQSNGGCKGIARNKAVFSGAWRNDELATAARLDCRIFA